MSFFWCHNYPIVGWVSLKKQRRGTNCNIYTHTHPKRRSWMSMGCSRCVFLFLGFLLIRNGVESTRSYSSIACLMIFDAAIFSTYKKHMAIWIPLWYVICQNKKNMRKKKSRFLLKLDIKVGIFFLFTKWKYVFKTSKFILIAAKYYNYSIKSWHFPKSTKLYIYSLTFLQMKQPLLATLIIISYQFQSKLTNHKK
jgi:hypothetical protein